MSRDTEPARTTEILRLVQAGDTNASARLLPLVYDQLRQLARARLAKAPAGNTLQPTALVHEAYLRLVDDGDDSPWEHRGHFFGAAAQAMRDILVEQARRKSRLKAGGGRQRVALEGAEDEVAAPEIETPLGIGGGSEGMLALDEAITRLKLEDPRKAEAVMLKYFAGLEHDKIAAIMGVSVPTIDRELRFARAWLSREVKGLSE